MSKDRPLIVGVLNITPDSFSDGGDYDSRERAIARGLELFRQGADMVDVGGESTRPGATLVGPEEEQKRVLEVIAALAENGVRVSVDTINASTARLAVLAGARVINDVSGGTYDTEMPQTMAELSASHGVQVVLGHWRGVPDPEHKKSRYENVVYEVRDTLVARAEKLLAAGVSPKKIMIDPGFGFDKTSSQGWQILRNIDALLNTPFRVMIGVSRKRMMGDIVQQSAHEEKSFSDRDLATAVVSAFAARAGVQAIRVHDVTATVQALAVENLFSGTQAPSDKITLTGLEVFAHHGVFDFEREKGQTFILDIEVTVDMGEAIAGDALAETVHYGELADRVVAAVANDPVDLIETVAERVASVALEFAATKEVRVVVHKPDAPIDHTFADVSVSIVRSR